MKQRNSYQLPAISAALASAGFAADKSAESYGVLFWVFISFGVLIVLAQLIPAILVIAGFVKGLPAKRRLAEAVKAERGA